MTTECDVDHRAWSSSSVEIPDTPASQRLSACFDFLLGGQKKKSVDVMVAPSRPSECVPSIIKTNVSMTVSSSRLFA